MLEILDVVRVIVDVAGLEKRVEFEARELQQLDWVVGVAGPFLVNDQPTFESLGGTFSRFESLSEKPLDEHVEALLGTVEGISGTEG